MNTSSNIGNNCWSSLRQTDSCFKCDKYATCKYPERVSDSGYNSLITRRAAIHKEYLKLGDDLKKYGMKNDN